MQNMLESLSVGALLRFASARSAGRAAVRPSKLDNDLTLGANFRTLSALQRLVCLQQLQQAYLHTDTCSSVAGAHFGILSQCRSLQAIMLSLDFDINELPLSSLLVDHRYLVHYRDDAVEHVVRDLLEAMPTWVDRTVLAKRFPRYCHCCLKTQTFRMIKRRGCSECMVWKIDAGTSAYCIDVEDYSCSDYSDDHSDDCGDDHMYSDSEDNSDNNSDDEASST